jgi:aminoglycoside phosphotransferase (APT) family kinase protein/adenylate kinase family enzyme
MPAQDYRAAILRAVRLIVIGNSGSGKSSYAKQLARLHDLAYLDLDSIFWEPHQIAIARPVADVRADLERFIAQGERWVIEGCYGELAEVALDRCTELVFMNPGLAACLDNDRRRPWEPHKYDSAAEQERMLAPLLAWVESYYTRTDPQSYAFHRRLFDAHPGAKRELDERATAIVHVFPALRPGRIARLEGGWTCETYEVGDRIVQLARTPYAAETLRRQATVLPKLAPLLGTAVPRPDLVADRPAAISYPRLDGIPCDRVPDGAWPEQLGRFVGELHRVSPERIGIAAQTTRAHREQVRADIERMRVHVAPRLAPAERARADAMVAALIDDDRNWRFDTALTHGDLGPEHVLVSPAGDLVGVIDWEDVGPGDPAGDFAWWLHAMPAPAERMLAAYGGPTDDRFSVRARILFALMPWHEVEHGAATADASLIDSGIAGARERLL